MSSKSKRTVTLTDRTGLTRSGRKIIPRLTFDPSDDNDSDRSKSPVKSVKIEKFTSPTAQKTNTPKVQKTDTSKISKSDSPKSHKKEDKNNDLKTTTGEQNKYSPTNEASKNTLSKIKYASPDENNSKNSKDDNLDKNVLAKTPYSLRQRLKTKIQLEVDKEEVMPFDASESEWEESESESSDSEEEDEVLAAPLTSELKPIISLKQSSHYVCSSSDYLDKSSGKSLTSSHRLKKLEDINEVNNLLSSYAPSHSSQITLLNKHNQTLFYKWMYALSKNYNLIIYGLGSKKKLLDLFRTTNLNYCKAITINGFFPGLTIKEILSSICELLGNKIKESMESIISALEQLKYHLFIIIHNIDGLALRQDKIQMFLSQISSYNKVHLICSIDHINAPLLWDQKKLSNFNFIWEECTTYLPYSSEKNFESSLMVRTSANMELSSLRNVFRSLNKNSRNIFKLLLEHSLNRENKNYGMQFSELYRLCRRNFIVSSDLALRTQLTEFIDHQLVRWRKETDMLTVSVDRDVLKTFKSEIDTIG